MWYNNLMVKFLRTRHVGLLLAGFLLLLIADNYFYTGSLPGSAIFDGGGLNTGLERAQDELQSTGIRPDTNLIASIAALINYILPYVGIIAVVAFIVAGFMFILGFGSDTAIQRAKKIMIWSAVGLIVILLAFPVTRFIVQFAS